MVQLPEAQSDQDDLMLPWSRDPAFYERYFEFFCVRFCHAYPSSSTDLPRSAATCSALLNLINPLIVALTTLCGLLEPRDLQSTFRTPTTSSTDLLAPPAINPVPSDAGLSKTFPAP
jgi:hypothetical protein